MEEFRCCVPHIVFGNGKLKSLGDFVREWANNAFLVIDPYLDKIGLGDEVVTLLKRSSIETSKYTDIKPNPDCFGVDKAAEVAEAMDPAVKSLSFREKAEKCAELVERLLKDINCIVRFGDFGLKEKDIEKVTHIALTGYYFDINSHPKQVTPEDIKRIYRECI